MARPPPCADALIAAGIARVVVAMEDPDPRVSGRGIDRLRERGIERRRSASARARRRRSMPASSCASGENRPLVTLKLAMTLDGRIATRTGESRWITGEPARARAHLLRAQHDAVMVGSGTVLADDPLLNVRLPGLERHSPLRIVLDGRMRLPLTSALVVGARQTPTWLVTLPGGDRRRRRAYQRLRRRGDRGRGRGRRGRSTSSPCCSIWRERGLTRILVEGGARLAAALLREQSGRSPGHLPRAQPHRRRRAAGRRQASASTAWPSCRASQPQETVGSATLETCGAGFRAGAHPHAPRGRDVGLLRSRHVHRNHHRSRPGAQRRARRRHPDRARDAATIRPASRSAPRSPATASACRWSTRAPGWFAVDASAETLARTTLGSWQPGTAGQSRTAAEAGRRAGRPSGLGPCRRRGRDRRPPAGRRQPALRASACRLALAALHRAQGLDRPRRRLADGQRGRWCAASASTSSR